MTDLRTAAQQALEALENERYVSQYTHIVDAITALRAALAEPVQEPVASVTECEACFTPDVCQLRGTCDYYTASQMRIAAPPQRKPLFASEIVTMYDESPRGDSDMIAFARAIEQAHGIKENP